MTEFVFDRPPTFEDPNQVAQWVTSQLEILERTFNEGLRGFRFIQLHAEPEKAYDGLTVLADGTDWDPGSGQGVYTYYNSQWNKLG